VAKGQQLVSTRSLQGRFVSPPSSDRNRKECLRPALNPTFFLAEETVAGLSVVAVSLTFVLARLFPEIVDVETVLWISAALVVAMAVFGICVEVVEFRWGLIFTAKTTFLAGSTAFLAGGIISSILSSTYLDYSARDSTLTAVYFVMGTACFLVSYKMTGEGIQTDRLRARRLESLSNIQLWLGSLALLGLSVYGSLKWRASAVYFLSPDATLWWHVFDLLLPATVLLAMILVRQNATPLQRLIALLLLCPVGYVLVTTWSRRPLQALLLAGVVLYILYKRLGRSAQLGLCLGGLSLALPMAIVQGWYREAIKTEDLRIRYAKDYSNDITDSVAKWQLIDTFDTAAQTTHLYSSELPYLYGQSFLALLVNPIPRKIWPQKPVGFGYVLAQEIFQTSSPPTNFGPSIEGELYANGGLLAVILGMLVAGFTCKKYDALLLGSAKTEGAFLIYALGLYQFFFLVRGDFLDVSYTFIMSVAPVILIIRCLRRPRVTGEEKLANQKATSTMGFHARSRLVADAVEPAQ